MRHYDHHHATVAETFACETKRRAGTTVTATKPEAKPTSVVMDRLRRQAGQPAPSVATTRTNTTATRPARRAQATPAFVAYPASPKAVKYANDLINSRDTNLISLAASEVMMHLLEGKPVSAQECSLLIDDLRAAPRKDVKSASKPTNAEQGPSEAANGPSLRDLCEPLADKGYYALRTPGSADEIHYYRITRSKRGYVKVQEQASDTLYPVDYRRALAVVKAIIETGEEAARHLYADTLERCYACGRTLTDETSRALRIGPDCRSK